MSLLQNLIARYKNLFKREPYYPSHSDIKIELPAIKAPNLNSFVEIDSPTDDIEWEERGTLYRAVYKDFAEHTLYGAWHSNEYAAKRELLAYKRGGMMISDTEIAEADFPQDIGAFHALKCCIQVDVPDDIDWENGRNYTLYRAV